MIPFPYKIYLFWSALSSRVMLLVSHIGLDMSATPHGVCFDFVNSKLVTIVTGFAYWTGYECSFDLVNSELMRVIT
jgi:hypothetical protein